MAVKRGSKTTKARKASNVKKSQPKLRPKLDKAKAKAVLKAVPKAAPKVVPKAVPKADPNKELEDLLKAKQEDIIRKLSKVLADSTVRQNLIGIGGENALAIVRSFYGNQSDEELAKKLKIKISDVRATLNKLHNEGLVNYIREKDSETGWYSYSWSLNHDRIEKWATNQVIRLGTGAGSEEFYFCPSCGSSSITNFTSAAGADFRCERCNKLLEFIDEKRLAELHEKP